MLKNHYDTYRWMKWLRGHNGHRLEIWQEKKQGLDFVWTVYHNPHLTRIQRNQPFKQRSQP